MVDRYRLTLRLSLQATSNHALCVEQCTLMVKSSIELLLIISLDWGEGILVCKSVVLSFSCTEKNILLQFSFGRSYFVNENVLLLKKIQVNIIQLIYVNRRKSWALQRACFALAKSRNKYMSPNHSNVAKPRRAYFAAAHLAVLELQPTPWYIFPSISTATQTPPSGNRVFLSEISIIIEYGRERERKLLEDDARILFVEQTNG